jgi:hypothetical protein
MTETEDAALRPDEQAQLHLDADSLRLVIDGLDARQAAVLKLRFDEELSAREIQARLGLTPKRLEKIVTEAYKQVAAHLGQDLGRESPWVRRQRSLLLACEVGIASPRQRRRAQHMVDRDATCRAMLREMRATLHGVAAALPMPVLPDPSRHIPLVDGLLGRLDDIWLSIRHLPRGALERGLPIPSAAEQATAGGATIGGAATAKIVAFCLAAGGTATLCITGARQLEHDHQLPKKPTAARASKRVVEPERATATVVRLAPNSSQRHVTKPQKHETPVSAVRSTPPPSPAPRGSTEFGPGSLGSSSAPKAPATAPANGGGEFGP